jgi:hypothetical protein
MEINLSTFSLEDLRNMYERADSELKAALLSGAGWEEVQDKRRLVTELSIHLHKRTHRNSVSSPADTPLRSEER